MTKRRIAYFQDLEMTVSYYNICVEALGLTASGSFGDWVDAIKVLSGQEKNVWSKRMDISFEDGVVVFRDRNYPGQEAVLTEVARSKLIDFVCHVMEMYGYGPIKR